MTNLLIRTAQEINEILNEERLTDVETKIIDGTMYYLIYGDDQTSKWASEATYNEYLADFAIDEEEEEELSFDNDFFAPSPTEPSNVSFVLQTIGSSLHHENVTVNRADAGSYLTSGTLTVVATGDVIRSYTELVEAVGDDSTTKILFVKNKTGN